MCQTIEEYVENLFRGEYDGYSKEDYTNKIKNAIKFAEKNFGINDLQYILLLNEYIEDGKNKIKPECFFYYKSFRFIFAENKGEFMYLGHITKIECEKKKFGSKYLYEYEIIFKNIPDPKKIKTYLPENQRRIVKFIKENLNIEKQE